MAHETAAVTDETLEELERLAGLATQGPFTQWDKDRQMIVIDRAMPGLFCKTYSFPDADYIAFLLEHAPAVLAEVRRLRARVAFVEKEWAFSDSVIDSLAEAKDGYMEECDRFRAALTELVTLKDTIKTADPADYERRKPLAWREARRVLGLPEVEVENG